MNPIKSLARRFSTNARKKRAEIFRGAFALDESTRILDLGSEDGSHIKAVLENTSVEANNVFIADIDAEMVARGSKDFGFNPITIDEAQRLAFEDQYFDIVYCSSVIEHVTLPKANVWSVYSGHQFKKESLKRQKEFAIEIQRLGKQYFVQTPYRHFPIESHTWLPFLSWLPRWVLIPVLRVTNLFWVKKTNPDWHLLDKKEMSALFHGARIISERKFGLTKSIMAVSSNHLRPDHLTASITGPTSI